MDTNTTLYVLFKKPGTKDEWDDIKEVAGQDFEYEYQGGKKKEEARDD